MDTVVNEFLRSWTYKILKNDLYLNFDGKIDPQNFDIQKWLHVISADGYNQYKDLDWDYVKKERRGLKKLPKIAENARIESGYVLASVFMNITVVRDNIITEVIDGKQMDDFSSNPYDYDYGISPDEIQKALNEVYKKPQRTPFFAVTRDTAGQPVACPNCDGNGFTQCRKCDGSGREQYVDGTFASGEERIKTGQCSKCYGTGKLKCTECAGSGKRQLLSNQYQIVKSFEEVKKMSGYVIYSTSSIDQWDKWGQDFPIILDDENDYSEYSDYNYPLFGNHRYYGKKWLDFENKALKSGINKLYKNQKELIIDGNPTLPDILDEECGRMYEQNKSQALTHFEKENEQGKLACSLEKHLVIPIVRILYEYNNFEYWFDLYEFEDGKITCFFSRSHLPQLGFFKSLFI